MCNRSVMQRNQKETTDSKENNRHTPHCLEIIPSWIVPSSIYNMKIPVSTAYPVLCLSVCLSVCLCFWEEILKSHVAALKRAHSHGRRRKNAHPPVALASMGEAFKPHLQFFVLTEYDVCVCVWTATVRLPINRWVSPSTDIEFPSLMTHYRLH